MILSKFKDIKGLVLDIDGVLTDGSIFVNQHGDQLRTFHVRDGYAMQYAVKKGIFIFVISGGNSESVRKRLFGLGIIEIHLGISDKKNLLIELAQHHQLALDEIAYIGDDIPDHDAMKIVGLPICPADAVEEIKQISSYISPIRGGKGVVREVIEKILKLQDKWETTTSVTSE